MNLMTSATKTSRGGIPWGMLTLIVCVAAGVLAAAMMFPLQTCFSAMRAWLLQLGPAAAISFAVIFVVASATLLPAGPLSITAGLLFGIAGLPLAMIAAPTGASIAFAISRWILRDRVARIIVTRPLLAAIDGAIAIQGWPIVFLVRLSPLVPFNLQNYFFGATPIRFVPFLLATIAGILPNTALCVYVGTLGSTSLSAVGWPALILPCIGLLCSFVVVALVGIAARRTLLRSFQTQRESQS